jgi:hypothetical protein
LKSKKARDKGKEEGAVIIAAYGFGISIAFTNSENHNRHRPIVPDDSKSWGGVEALVVQGWGSGLYVSTESSLPKDSE